MDSIFNICMLSAVFAFIVNMKIPLSTSVNQQITITFDVNLKGLCWIFANKPILPDNARSGQMLTVDQWRTVITKL